MNYFIKRFLFIFSLSLFLCCFNILIFKSILYSNVVIIPYSFNPFNICEKFPDMWLNLKIIYIPITLFSSLICINHIYSFFFNKKILRKKISYSKNSLSLFISKDSNR